MRANSFTLTYSDAFPMLDEEFDKMDITPPPPEHAPLGPIVLCDDLAWDDQLDNGEEMSL